MYERELHTLELVAKDIDEEIARKPNAHYSYLEGLDAAKKIVDGWVGFYRCPEYTTTEYGRGRARARPTVR